MKDLVEASVLANIQEAGARECSNALHALATSGHSAKTHAHILTALEQQMQHVAHQSNPRDISNSMWALATLGRMPDAALLATFSLRISEIGSEFAPQNVANVLWAFAKLGAAPSDGVFAALAAQAIAKSHAFRHTKKKLISFLKVYNSLLMYSQRLLLQIYRSI